MSNSKLKQPQVLVPFFFICAYVCGIVGVNYGFAHFPPIMTSIGLVSPMAFVVGVIFILRDYVQRHIGHKVILVMLIGGLISFKMASPVVALASITAFACAEGLDWATFTFVPTTFHVKVLLSSVIGVFADTVIFLPMIGAFSVSTAITMYVSKLIAAVLVYIWYAKCTSFDTPLANA